MTLLLYRTPLIVKYKIRIGYGEFDRVIEKIM